MFRLDNSIETATRRALVETLRIAFTDTDVIAMRPLGSDRVLLQSFHIKPALPADLFGSPEKKICISPVHAPIG